MLDKGEYLGNFVICKENSVMNDDFSWTVYQNDQLRNLFNRTTREGKRLFCKVDQIGISDAYEQRIRGYDYEDMEVKEIPQMYLLSLEFGVRWWNDKDELIAPLNEFSIRQTRPLKPEECESSQWTGIANNHILIPIVANGKKYEDLITEINSDLHRQYPHSTLSLSYNSATKKVTMSYGFPLTLKPPPDGATKMSIWMLSHNQDCEPFCPNTLTRTKAGKLWINRTIVWSKHPIEPGVTWSFSSEVPEMVIRDKTRVVRVPVGQIGSVPINTQTIYWHHPDLTFANLNINPLTGLCYNNKVTTYDDRQGTFYEIIQMSPHPHMNFFIYSQNIDDNGWSIRQPVLVSDFHIQLSFYKCPGDFRVDKIKYLGNFVIGLENTKIDRYQQTMEVYQNDKVRSLLDKTNQKGKKLYAKIDQIAFEEVQRPAVYTCELHEWEYEQQTRTTTTKIKEKFNIASNLDISEIWTAISNQCTEISHKTRPASGLTYNMVYDNHGGLTLTVDNVPSVKDEYPLGITEYCWSIEFDKDLVEDYNIPRLIAHFDPYVRTHNEQGSNPGTIKQQWVAPKISMGKNDSFTTNHMYFYHPDLVGDNCNLEPVTIACQYPGMNHYNQQQYYYIRSLQAPTYIHFFYWVTEIENGKWKSVKKPYVPANFHVVISYYEGD